MKISRFANRSKAARLISHFTARKLVTELCDGGEPHYCDCPDKVMSHTAHKQYYYDYRAYNCLVHHLKKIAHKADMEARFDMDAFRVRLDIIW